MGDGTIFSKCLLGVVAIALEGAKILSWRKGGGYRLYAVVLIILSSIASLGASLQVVEKSKGSFAAIAQEDIRSSPTYLAQQDELRSINGEITTLVTRLQALPPDYTTAASRLELSLSVLRDRKQSILASLSDDVVGGVSQGYGSIILLLGRVLGFRPETLLLVLLLFVSASIEVGALLLTVPEHEDGCIAQKAIKPPIDSTTIGDTSSRADACLRPSYAPPITPEDFLEAAKDDADLPFLHGRDTTAEKLGISSAEAKRLVGRLIEDGRVVVEGKRLRLAQVKEELVPHI
jgi:hypothetical protein